MTRRRPAIDRSAQQAAQRRAAQIAAFQAELAALERDASLVLTSAQRQQIEAHHRTLLAALGGGGEAVRRFSWSMRVVTLLGGLAFCAAFVLFLHRVWGSLPVGAQVSVLVGAPLLLLAAAETTRRADVDPFHTALLAWGASVAFLAGFDTLRTICNATPSMHALGAWAAFGLLVAYAYGLRLLLAAALVLACAYAAAVWTAASGTDWTSFPLHAAGLLPPAATLYLVPALRRHPAARDFDQVYRLVGGGTAMLALLFLSHLGDLCCAGLSPRMLEGAYQFAGLALAVALLWHGLRLCRGGLVNLGTAGAVVFLFARLHAWWWDWMPKYLFFLLLGVIALGLLAVFRRLRARLLREAAA